MGVVDGIWLLFFYPFYRLSCHIEFYMLCEVFIVPAHIVLKLNLLPQTFHVFFSIICFFRSEWFRRMFYRLSDPIWVVCWEEKLSRPALRKTQKEITWVNMVAEVFLWQQLCFDSIGFYTSFVGLLAVRKRFMKIYLTSVLFFFWTSFSKIEYLWWKIVKYLFWSFCGFLALVSSFFC